NGDTNSALEVFSARLLFFPVRSFYGLFAYVTCPFIMQRFVEDMKKFHQTLHPLLQSRESGGSLSFEIPESVGKLEQNKIMACKDLIIGETKKVGLEEFLFDNYSEPIGDKDELANLMSWFADKTGIAR